MGKTARSVRRYFERQVRAVGCREPVIPVEAASSRGHGQRRLPPSIADRLVRGAAAGLAAAAILGMGVRLQRPAGLQVELAELSRGGAVELLFPNAGSAMDMIEASFGRRDMQ